MSLCSEIHEPSYISAVSGKKNVPSNVTRLCRALNSVGTDEEGNQWQQIVWYDSGIGTTSSGLGKKIEGAIGQGLEGNVVEAYNFCVLNYNPGDQIMCFGFSRGAFTARTIAGLISDIGICRKQDLNQFPDLWEVYKKNKPDERFYCSDLWFEWMDGKADENQGARGDHFVFEKRPEGDWAQEGSRDVEVVGVYDTVGAIGMPEVLGVKLPSWLVWWSDKAGWQNIGLSPSKYAKISPSFFLLVSLLLHSKQTTDTRSSDVKHAFQALALDEHRNAFSPTLWWLHKFGNVTSEQIETQKQAVESKAQEWDTILQEAIRLKDSGRATDEEVNNAARKLNATSRALNQETRKWIKLQDDYKHQQHPRTLRQVWFPGYHVNIGGGSEDTLENEGDMEEMSNITFAWMLDQIKPHLSLNEEYLTEEREAREYHMSTLEVTTTHDKSWGAWIKRKAGEINFVFKNPSMSAAKHVDKHRSYGWGTGPLKDSFTPFYYLNGSKRRTPGGCDPFDEDGKQLGETFEYIHPVVGFRQKQIKDYMPIGNGVKFNRWEAVDEKGHPSYVYDLGDGRKSLPEWRLGEVDSYERLAIASKAAYDYVDELDLHLKTGIRTPRRSVWGVRDTDLGIEISKDTESRNECLLEVGFKSQVFKQRSVKSTGFESEEFQVSSSEVLYRETVT
ncbi:hypothetical protein N7475_005366 [Penicillium sp. IBT 31633x]|nr:hypothetical protein N7475_005366 [Penicillium sp. IBT 31633x]